VGIRAGKGSVFNMAKKPKDIQGRMSIHFDTDWGSPAHSKKYSKKLTAHQGKKREASGLGIKRTQEA